MADTSTEARPESATSFDVRIRVTDEREWGPWFPARLIVTQSQLIVIGPRERSIFYPFHGKAFRQRMIIAWWSMTFGRPIPVRVADLKWPRDETSEVCDLHICVPKPVAETICVKCINTQQSVEMEKAVTQLFARSQAIVRGKSC
jgi:hypothetical protein